MLHLKKEADEHSQKKVTELIKTLDDLEAKSLDMTAKWQAEKLTMQISKKLKKIWRGSP